MPTMEDPDPIHHLDFEPALPCEHDQHDEKHGKEAAHFYVLRCCPHCQKEAKYFLCRSGWQVMENDQLSCEHCKETSARNDGMKIIDIIKAY